MLVVVVATLLLLVLDPISFKASMPALLTSDIHVAHMRARDVFHGSAAHPHAEGQLHVLGPVVQDFRVICAQMEEELTVHGKQPA
jgi:hypothetical protein